MTPIPLSVQLEKTHDYYFVRDEFKQRVIKKACETKCRDIIPCFSEILYDMNLMPDTENNPAYDRFNINELTFGMLCSLIRDLPPGCKRSRFSLLAGRPFYLMGRAERKKSEFEKDSFAAFVPEPQKKHTKEKNIFDPHLLNSIYHLNSNDEKPQYFYWMNLLSRDEFLRGVIALTDSNPVRQIMKKRRRYDTMYEFMLEVGRTLACHADIFSHCFVAEDDYDGEEDDFDPNYRTVCKEMQQLIDDYIINPFAEVHKKYTVIN